MPHCIVKTLDGSQLAQNHIKNLQAIGKIISQGSDLLVVQLHTRSQIFEAKQYCETNDLKFSELLGLA